MGTLIRCAILIAVFAPLAPLASPAEANGGGSDGHYGSPGR